MLFSKRSDGNSQCKYDQRNAIHIPNDKFAEILELFERYNFTVIESTPIDIEVAVDPEMLGKVFEELVTGRHDTGQLPHPASRCLLMCRESLKSASRTKPMKRKNALKSSLMMAMQRQYGIQKGFTSATDPPYLRSRLWQRCLSTRYDERIAPFTRGTL